MQIGGINMNKNTSLNDIEKDLVIETIITKYKFKIIKSKLQEEYYSASKRQRIGAGRDSGFMSGILKSIKIIEDIESVSQMDMFYKIIERR